MLRILIITLLIQVFFSEHTFSQKITEVRVKGKVEYTGGNFGYSVSVKDNIALVSSPYKFHNGTKNSGLINVFQKDAINQWKYLYSIQPDSSTTYLRFGTSLDFNGTTAVVGTQMSLPEELVEAPTDFNQPASPGVEKEKSRNGKVFIIEQKKSRWKIVQTLQPPGQESNASFGNKVFIFDNTIVVGAPYRPISKQGGSIYIYQKEKGGKWTFVQKISSPESSLYDLFGTAVSFDKDRLYVGSPSLSPLWTENSVTPGSVFIFKWTKGRKWIFEQKITSPNKKSSDNFGISIAHENGVLAIGASKVADTIQSEIHEDKGAVYLYREDVGIKYKLWQKLDIPEANRWDRLGEKVVLRNGLLLISSMMDNEGLDGQPEAHMSGSVHVVKQEAGRYVYLCKLVAFDRFERAHFGYDLSFDGKTILIGAPFKGELFNKNLIEDVGGTYFYEVTK